MVPHAQVLSMIKLKNRSVPRFRRRSLAYSATLVSMKVWAIVCATGCLIPIQSRQPAHPQPSPEKAKRIETLEGELAKAIEQKEVLLSQSRALHKRVQELEEKGKKRRRRSKTPDPNVRYQVLLGNAPIRGPRDALLTIVWWGDFQTPFFKPLRPVLERVLKTYQKDVRLVFKHIPQSYHKNAVAAAIAAEAAARQGKFWEMGQIMRDNYRALSKENLLRWADNLGLDLNKFKKAQVDPVLRQRVEADRTQAARLGVRFAPSFSINGRYINGLEKYEAFEKLIEEELETAKQLIKSGVERERVYDTLMKGRPASL